MFRHLPIVTLLVAGLVLIAGMEPLATMLEFDRRAMDRGELWRWGTAHLTHFDRSHLTWDLAVFALLGGEIERRGRIQLIVTITAAALAVSAAVWWGLPHLVLYRGLSGIDSALFGFLAGRLLGGRSRRGRLTGAFALTAFGVKSWLEMQSGAPIFAAVGYYETVPLAHLAGLIVGVAVACVPWDRETGTAGTVTVCRSRGSDSETPPPSPSGHSFPAQAKQSRC